MRVLDHAQASDTLRADAIKPVNPSANGNWQNYYTSRLAERVYKTYEIDFDWFEYPTKTALKAAI